MAAYFARQAFMVGSDGAAHVSKPARVPPGAAWVGTGDGLLASTGPVGFGVGLGVDFGVGLGVDFGVDLGVDLEPDGGVLGGVSQDAPGPVIASALGQAGFLAVTCAAARVTTGCPVLRIESPARSGPACLAAACLGEA